MASVDGAAAGFVSGVETTHPDKGTEMFLYELSVHPDHRGRGVATALVAALEALARARLLRDVGRDRAGQRRRDRDVPRRRCGGSGGGRGARLDLRRRAERVGSKR